MNNRKKNPRRCHVPKKGKGFEDFCIDNHLTDSESLAQRFLMHSTTTTIKIEYFMVASHESY